MLANAIDKNTLAILVHNDDWFESQKIDGRRALIRIEDGEVEAYGRGGRVFELPYLIRQSLRSTLPNGQWFIDGEVAKTDGTHHYFFAFDLVLANGVVDPTTPFEKRLQALEHLSKLTRWDDHTSLGVLYYAKTTKEKLDLVSRLHVNHAEGVVLRQRNAPYTEAIRSDCCLKYKFVLEADCVVMDIGVDGKDNVRLGVYRDGVLTDIGKCTALSGDGGSIKIGDVVVVKYLYVSDDGRLVQPTYPLIRTDKIDTECTFDQLVPASRKVLTRET